MSVFKSKCIVLKVERIKATDMLYTLFSHDFWVIKCSKKLTKQEKNLDIGYLINCEIHGRESRSIHSIRNIHIIHEFRWEASNFSTTMGYLELVNQVLRHAPSGMQVFHVYDLFEAVLQMKHINEEKLLLARLKLLQIFWVLPDHHIHPTIQKILKFIHENTSKKVLLLTGISDEIEIKLKQIMS